MLFAGHRFSDGADGSNPGPQGLEARTRDRVRKTIAEDGPLTAAGHARRDSDYNGVATSALRSLAEHAGTDAVDAFARERRAELEARYALQLAAAGQDVTARAQALSKALTADGFAASTYQQIVLEHSKRPHHAGLNEPFDAYAPTDSAADFVPAATRRRLASTKREGAAS